MTEHRTEWHRLTVRTDDGLEVEALGWRHSNAAVWVLDRFVDNDSFAYAYGVTDLGPADVLVLPAPSGPVVKHTWGWECGNVEADDLADADAWAAELPQHIADSRAIAAHIRGLGEVWLDPEPVVPRPEPEAQRVEAAKIDLMISDQLGEPRDPWMTALAEGTETKVEWSVATPAGSPTERLVCMDEQDAHDTLRLPSDRVESRTVTTSPWRNA